MSKSIVLFTIDFPYGSQEVFLENELPFLSDAFDSIRIIPLFPKSSIRNIEQKNIEIREPILKSRITYFKALIKTLFYKAFISCLKSSGLSLTKLWKSFKQAIIITNTYDYLDKNKDLKSADLWYFYWGTNTVNVLPFLREHPRSIARFHGFDLYEEDISERPPQVLRKEILERLSEVHVITQDGINYLTNKYPQFKSKYILSRLGVADRGINTPSQDGVFRMMTCSNIYKIKRLDLLARALKEVSSIQIEWIHFGDGEKKLETELFALTKQFPMNVKFSYKGRVPNKDVIEHLKNSPVDLFVNVSLSEGLPVSIMEALSFGIPVLATDCGGIRELVNDSNGQIIPIKTSVQFLLSCVANLVVTCAEKRLEARTSWEENVDSNSNYTKFYLGLNLPK